MVKNRVFNFFFLLFICSLAFSTVKVKAYTFVDDECLDEGTCILLCSYNNKSSDYNNASRNISLYYFLESKDWKLSWEGSYSSSSNKYVVREKGPDNLGYIFSKNGTNVYSSDTPSTSTFRCYEHGYLDYSRVWHFNEVCFDNDGKTCKEEYNNFGTAFKDNDYVSDSKEYDFEDDLNRYVDNWSFGDVSCDDIYHGSVDVDSYDYIMNKFTNDLKNNYLHGYDIPEFISNSAAFSDVGERTAISLRNKINECREENNQSLESNAITQEEFNNREEVLNNINPDEAGENFENAFMQLSSTDIDIQVTDIGCDDIFGKEEGSFGWLLNTILGYIRVIGPILVVLLSAIDFIKAVVGFDEKAMKEAQNKLIIRLVCAVALFLVPTLVQLLFSFINETVCTLN